MALHRNTKLITSCGMLVASAIILGYIESLLPLNIGVPGAKIGLANIITFLALYLLDRKYALIILVLRILIIGITFTNLYMMIYSMVGGLLSLLVMMILKKFDFGMIVVSIMGGISHNIGQTLVAMVFFSSTSFVYYLPYLIIIGMISGTLIGLTGSMILSRIKNTDS